MCDSQRYYMAELIRKFYWSNTARVAVGNERRIGQVSLNK